MCVRDSTATVSEAAAKVSSASGVGGEAKALLTDAGMAAQLRTETAQQATAPTFPRVVAGLGRVVLVRYSLDTIPNKLHTETPPFPRDELFVGIRRRAQRWTYNRRGCDRRCVFARDADAVRPFDAM